LRTKPRGFSACLSGRDELHNSAAMNRHDMPSELLRRHLAGVCNGNFELVTNRLNLINDAVPHSVQLIDAPEICPLDSQNCVMYAFGLRLNPAYEPDGRYYAGTAYVQGLINDGYLIERTSKPDAGLIAVYFRDHRVTHVGIATNHARIVSKWGDGFVYSHPPFEVPANFGDTITYFEPIAKRVAYMQLRRW
jgi:hypothetical protein